MYDEDFEGYDVAQTCLNGHVVNSSSRQIPTDNSPFCGKCGAKTITQCPSCKKDIRGFFWGGEGYSYERSSYCLDCGKPYPWTESALEAARELAQEFELTSKDKEELAKSIDDIISDSPRTALGASRFKRIMAKVGREGAELFKEILIGVVSGGASNMIWGK